MTSNFISNNVPVGIGYDSYGNAKGLVELSQLSLNYLTMVSSKDDLPDAVDDVITLLPNYAYWFLTEVDLSGCRLVLGENTAIIGSSSETSKIKSTGLTTSALITSNYTFPMKDITLESSIALNLSALDRATNNAIDWFSVNFQDCPTIGTISDYTNVIISDGAFLNSANLTFDGTIDTIGFNGCIFSVSADNTGIILADTLTVSRRFRVVYTAIVAGSPTSLGVSASELVSMPTEAYIYDTVNFAGGGGFVSGIQSSSIESLWVNCIGVTNTSHISNYFMASSVATLPTAFSAALSPTKVLGTTTSNSITQKFSNATSNRATYTGGFTRNFKVTAIATSTGGNSKQYAFYVAKNGEVLTESRSVATTSTTRAENITSQAIVLLAPNEYIEIWVEGVDTTNDIYVEDLNVIVEALA